MITNLTLKENFVLLCFHPEKGRMLNTAHYASYGIAGAVMLELAGMEKYKIENKKLVLNDAKPTGDKALDLVVQRIAKSSKHTKLSSWISFIVQSGTIGKVKHAILESLMAKRILSKREKTALLIFKYNRYPSRNTRPRRHLIAEIQNVIIKRQIGNKDILMLIALIGATKMEGSFFLREDRATARKRVKEIMKNNEVAKMLDSTVTAVQAAVITTITTSAVVSAAATSSH